MKKILLYTLFFISGLNASATNFGFSVAFISQVNCQFYTLKVTVSGGVGPFSYAYSDNMSGLSIFYTHDDTVIVQPPFGGTFTGNGCTMYVTVTDLSDGTSHYNGGYVGHYVDFTSTSSPIPMIVHPPSACGNGCDGWLEIPVPDFCNNYFPVHSCDLNGRVHWSNGGGGGIATNLCPGTYTATVDIGNPLCPEYVDFIGTVPPQPLPTNPPHVTLDSIVNGFCFSTAYASVMGGTGNISFVWDAIVGASVDSLLNTGHHLLTVYDALGCHDTISFNTASVGNMVASTVAYTTCNNANDSAIAIINGGLQPYSFQWNTIPIQNTQIATGLMSGNYSVVVTDSAGCLRTSSATLPISTPQHFYIDEFSTCNSTTLYVMVNGGILPYNYSWSNNATTSTISIQQNGIYTITVTDHAGCNLSKSVNVQTNYTNDVFGTVFNDLNGNCIHDSGENPVGSVLIQAQPGNYFSTSDIYGNFHLVTSSGAYSINATPLDQYFNLNCTLNYNHTFTGYCNTLSNLNFLGTYNPNVKDLEVTLTASVVRPGFGMAYYINYRNAGTIPLNGTVHFFHDTLLMMNTSVPLYNSYSMQQADFNFTNLQQGESRLITIYMNVATPQNGGILGDSISATTNIDPVLNDSNPVNNTSEIYTTFVGSYDPNNKSVSPEGNLIDYDSLVTYTVRFQNTGTDTAFNIVIIDTLSNNFDLTTFKWIGYSHLVSWNIKDHGVLVCTFRNIFLPDSNRNEIESHGFVKYAVKLKQGLINQSVIENKADIFFDFNNPVTTNSTSNIYVSTVGINELHNNTAVQVYPIPSSGDVFFKWNVIEVNEIEIRDNTKRLILSNKTVGMDFLLTQNILTETGVYLYSLKDNSGKILLHGKFLIVK